MKFEGGFQGRTNKLVDGCYSFWQGGSFPLLHKLLKKGTTYPIHLEQIIIYRFADEMITRGDLLFHQQALQEYILICCQNSSGGLLDKPGKPRDIYHTCYTLSGLAVAQQSHLSDPVIIGSSGNHVGPTHPIYNINPDLAYQAMKYFSKLPIPQLIKSSWYANRYAEVPESRTTKIPPHWRF